MGSKDMRDPENVVPELDTLLTITLTGFFCIKTDNFCCYSGNGGVL